MGIVPHAPHEDDRSGAGHFRPTKGRLVYTPSTSQAARTLRLVDEGDASLQLEVLSVER
jgi:hypothetical protein